jgi:hypothetical protein
MDKMLKLQEDDRRRSTVRKDTREDTDPNAPRNDDMR